MTVAMLGGSGSAGRVVVRRLLDLGMQVRALVRNPESLSELSSNPGLTIIKGDALIPEDIDTLLRGCEAVVNTLGHRPGSPPNLQEKSIEYVIDSMKKYNIKRLICLTGSGITLPGDRPSWADNLLTNVIKILDPHRLNDASHMVSKILQSGLDWTIVRTPLQHSYKLIGKRHVGLVGDTGSSIKCSRDFIADFIAECLNTGSYIHQYPCISD